MVNIALLIEGENQQCGFRTGPTQTGLYSRRRWLETEIRIEKVEDLYYLCSENKALINFAVTAKLICAFVFAYADCWFSHAAAHILCIVIIIIFIFLL